MNAHKAKNAICMPKYFLSITTAVILALLSGPASAQERIPILREDQHKIGLLMNYMSGVRQLTQEQEENTGHYPTSAKAMVSLEAFLSPGGNSGNITDESELAGAWQHLYARMKIKDKKFNLSHVYPGLHGELQIRAGTLLFALQNFPADKLEIAKIIYRKCNFLDETRKVAFTPGQIDVEAHHCGYTANHTGLQSIDHYIGRIPPKKQ